MPPGSCMMLSGGGDGVQGSEEAQDGGVGRKKSGEKSPFEKWKS